MAPRPTPTRIFLTAANWTVLNLSYLGLDLDIENESEIHVLVHDLTRRSFFLCIVGSIEAWHYGADLTNR